MKELQPDILKGKKILFLAPAFFNYETIIRDKMIEMGAVVYMYDERSVKGAFYRALNKVVPKWFYNHSHAYFHDIIMKHKHESFDYILIIKSDMTPPSTLVELKTTFPNAELILYLYDSIQDIPEIEKKFQYFDRLLTFDRVDANNTPNFEFRPLFFSDDYVANGMKNHYRYDIAFIGTIHSDRYKVLKKLIEQIETYQLKSYWFLYLQANFMFYWFWLTKREFKWKDKRKFTTERMRGAEISAIVDETKTIIDIESPGQKGLTMRTIEMLGLKKKLITTNQDVKKYDFFIPDNICVIDRKNPVLPMEFIEKPYQDIPEEIYLKYHIYQWVLDVLGIK